MEKLILVQKDLIRLEGMLKIPCKATGLVIFAHGSGSSRFSPRNNFVAKILHESGLATLLIDLLSEKEDKLHKTRFDIDLLTERLILVVQWINNQVETKCMSLGLFGSSTGAAAALQVASRLGSKIKGVVTRGGRPDLVMDELQKVISPTLFVVGGNDFGVIALNEKAFDYLNCDKRFDIVPNATHLFEEPGCTEEVAKLATEWFNKYLISQ